MWSAIGVILQIIFLVIKNMFEKDAEEKKRKEALYAEAKTAIANRDLSAINSVFDRMR